MSNWCVLKFGGSSVANPAAWKVIEQQIRKQKSSGRQPLLVLSALKEVSNMLEALLHQAKAGVHQQAISRLRQLHYRFSSELGLDGHRLLDRWFKQLMFECDNIHHANTIRPTAHAMVVSFGELFSTVIGAAYLTKVGLSNQWQDVRDWLVTTDNRSQSEWHHFTYAECDLSRCNQPEIEKLRSFDVVVTQGFIARDRAGNTVLLGREGSDTSASYLAAITEAHRLEIWTDVPGVFSMNPRDNQKARQIKHLHFEQMELLAEGGAKVIHSRAIKPVITKSIPLFIRSTERPEHLGTEISSEYPSCSGGVALAEIRDIVRFSEVQSPDELLNKLMPLGFDPITLPFDAPATVLVKYTNTEKQRPTIDQLEALTRCPVVDRQTLITVVGDQYNTQWIDEIESHCNSQMSTKRCVILKNRNKGLVGILLDLTSADLFAVQLHSAMIESKNNNDFYTQCWEELV